VTETDFVHRVVEEVDASLVDGLVPAVIYNNEDIHNAELERIFSKTWIFIGHESEIPRPGDYCLRYIADDPFIFVRDESGEIRVLFDACRHRGTQVCRADMGNTSHFRCPYHGWIYRNDGRLAGVPAMATAYKGLDRSKWGLIRAPHVESVRGLVFACLDPDAPSIDEYLGDMKWYLEMVFGLGKVTVIGAPQRWVINANWKLGAENFAGDDYHTITLHKSMYDIDVIGVPPQVNMIGHHIWAKSEHATHAVSFGIDDDPDSQLWWGMPPEVVALLDKSLLTSEQLDLARRSRTTVGTVFPNFSFIFVYMSADPANKPLTPMLGVRQWRPRGPGEIELWSWILAWDEAPAEFIDATYQLHMATFGTAGIFEQDDTEPWITITRTCGSTFARQSNYKLNYQMGSPGIGTSAEIDDWPGPGVAFNTRYEEGVMRNLIQDWVRYMRNGHGPSGSANGR
jgi:phenylpropionate dioxygenase-like ring-hydroxylating dioxygenase large terminal subunit